MRPLRIVIAMLAVGLLAGDGWAGVYNLKDAPPAYPALVDNAYEDIRLVLDPLRAAIVPVVPDQASDQTKRLADELEAKPAKDSTPQDRLKLGVCRIRLGQYQDAIRVLRAADRTSFVVRVYLQEAELEAKAPGDLTTPDRINLGACYIRLGRTNDAVAVLSAADQNDFLVLANLAAAYQSLNELERAVAYEEQAVASWPSIQAGWSTSELDWFRRVEGYNLKLLKLRLREKLANPTVKRWDTMDALFDKPSPAGAEYEARIQSWKMWGDLPPDGYHLMAQLLVWSPNDDRLYWQLGEILNAKGNMQAAYRIFDELISARSESTVQQLQAHRKALMAYLEVAKAANTAWPSPGMFQTDLHELVWAISPRGLLLPPGVGDVANETAMAATAQAYSTPPAPPPPQASQPRGWQIDWQPIFVGFAAGLIVATLGALQWTEWRRRRLAAMAPPPASAPPAVTSPSPRTEPAVHDAGTIRTDAPAAPHRMEGTP